MDAIKVRERISRAKFNRARISLCPQIVDESGEEACEVRVRILRNPSSLTFSERSWADQVMRKYTYTRSISIEENREERVRAECTYTGTYPCRGVRGLWSESAGSKGRSAVSVLHHARVGIDTADRARRTETYPPVQMCAERNYQRETIESITYINNRLS